MTDFDITEADQYYRVIQLPLEIFYIFFYPSSIFRSVKTHLKINLRSD